MFTVKPWPQTDSSFLFLRKACFMTKTQYNYLQKGALQKKINKD